MSPWFLGSIVVTAASWIAWLVLFLGPVDFFPERVPIHWNIDFEPDGWASSSAARLWLLCCPLFVTAFLVLNIALPRLSRAAFGTPEDRRLLDYILFLVSVFSLWMMAVFTHAMATTHLWPTPFLGSLFLFFAFLGPAMRDVKRNGVVGIRTPWTLADDAVWVETHRLAAQMWLAAGAIGFSLVLIGAPLWLPFVALMGAVLYPILHSYLVAQRLNRSR